MKRVDCIIAGAQKAGTSALLCYMDQHPNISFANTPNKEAHFFSRHNLSAEDYRQYHHLYDHADANKLWVDKTPGYLYLERVPRRIWHYNANVKILVILRNPVDRAYSQYQMMIRNQWTVDSFEDVLERDRQKMLTNAPLQYSGVIADKGFYVEQLRRYQRYFRDEQILIVKNEDLRTSPQATMDQIFRFVDQSPFAVSDIQFPLNNHYQPMKQQTRAMLARIYYYEIKQLEVLFGINCSDWLEKMEAWM